MVIDFVVWSYFLFLLWVQWYEDMGCVASEDVVYWQSEERKGQKKGRWEKEENKLKVLREIAIYYFNLIS